MHTFNPKVRQFFVLALAVALLSQSVIFSPLPTANATPGDATFIQVANGTVATIALKSDGTVWAWGGGGYGQLGDGTTTDHSAPAQVHGPGDVGFLEDVIQVAMGEFHAVALKSDGTVWAWGWSTYGAVGDGSSGVTTTPVQVHGVGDIGFLTDVVAITAGRYYTLAIKNDGTVVGWGRNFSSELGDGTSGNTRSVPVVVSGLSDVVAVAGGSDHSLALKSDGTVRAWGYNFHGQLGDGSTTNRTTPVTVTGLTDVKEIAASGHSVAVKNDGTVWAWGYNGLGQLGIGTTDFSSHTSPVQVHGPGNVGFLTGVKSVKNGWFQTIALKSDGTVWAWGYNNYGQLGDGTSTDSTTPVQVLEDANATVGVGPYLTEIQSIAAFEYISFTIKSDGTIWGWGNNNAGQLGIGDGSTHITPVKAISPAAVCTVRAVSSGLDYTLAIKSDGSMLAWGGNASGMLGDGTTTDQSEPVEVLGMSNVVMAAGGSAHSIALKSDGTVWAWGYGSLGQIGDGTTNQRLTAVQVHGPLNVGFLDNVIQITAGIYHSTALKSDGTVWSWGTGSALGDGGSSDSNVPVQVSGITNAVAIASGPYANHTLALLSDGTVRAWGGNANGQLGDGSTTDRTSPVTVSGLSAVKDLAVGREHSFVLRSDGTLQAWGRNAENQLGDGTTTQRTTPVTISGGIIARALGSGNYSGHAIDSDGLTWGWGDNSYGQIGDGTFTTRSTPVQISAMDDAVTIGGSDRTVAYKADGTAWIWGSTYTETPSESSTGLSCLGVPEPITDLVATPGLASVTLAWTAPFDYFSAITEYEVHYSTDGFASDDQTCATTSCTDTTPGALLTGLEIGTELTFRVYSINGEGTSAVSNEAVATPTVRPYLADNVIGQSLFDTQDSGTSATLLNSPYRVAYDDANDRLFVPDLGNHRVLVYDTSGGITDGMAATYVLGQNDGNSNLDFFDDGIGGLSQDEIADPGGVVYDSVHDRLFVAESGNNRISIYDLSGGITNGMNAAFELGQNDDNSNLDFFDDEVSATSQSGFFGPWDLAYDELNDYLFVADFNNSRVLVFDLSGGITNGMNAAYVLGQNDFNGNLDFFDDAELALTQNGMNYPSGLAYDQVSNTLFVADMVRRGILVFDLSGGITNGMNASFVLGQENFTSDVFAFSPPTRDGLGDMYGGIAYDSVNSRLFATDWNNNRVVVYDISDGIINGEDAADVFGQVDFVTGDLFIPPTQSSLFMPLGVSYDETDERLFIADSFSSRILVFDVGVAAPPSGGGGGGGGGSYNPLAPNAPSGQTCDSPNDIDLPSVLEVQDFDGKPQVVLQWDSSELESTEVIEVLRDGSKIATLSSSKMTYTDTDITANECPGSCRIKLYTYTLRTMNACGTKTSGSSGTASINPTIQPGIPVTVTADISLIIKDGFSILFDEKLAELEESEPTLSINRSFTQLTAEEDDISRENLLCGGKDEMSCTQEDKEMIEAYFQGSSQAANIIVKVRDDQGSIVLGPVQARTNIFGQIYGFSLGTFLSGKTYKVEVTLPDEEFALPRVVAVTINNPLPTTIDGVTTFSSHIKLSPTEQFCFGDFDGDGNIDLNDILTIPSLVEDMSSFEDALNLDGLGGFDLLDMLTLLKNFQCEVES